MIHNKIMLGNVYILILYWLTNNFVEITCCYNNFKHSYIYNFPRVSVLLNSRRERDFRFYSVAGYTRPLFGNFWVYLLLGVMLIPVRFRKVLGFLLSCIISNRSTDTCTALENRCEGRWFLDETLRNRCMIYQVAMI